MMHFSKKSKQKKEVIQLQLFFILGQRLILTVFENWAS